MLRERKEPILAVPAGSRAIAARSANARGAQAQLLWWRECGGIIANLAAIAPCTRKEVGRRCNRRGVEFLMQFFVGRNACRSGTMVGAVWHLLDGGAMGNWALKAQHIPIAARG